MHLMFYLNEKGERVYTLLKAANGKPTESAHPARFSPDDKPVQTFCSITAPLPNPWGWVARRNDASLAVHVRTAGGTATPGLFQS